MAWHGFNCLVHSTYMTATNHSLCPRDCAGRGLEWQALLGEPLFRDADEGGSATLAHAIDIFVERHHLLWKVHCVFKCHIGFIDGNRR